MPVPLRCRCGAVTGSVDPDHVYGRAVCYCKDCQAYARFLAAPDTMDAHGGTDIVATPPAGFRLATGVDRLACVSLAERGLLRWYAACCRTAIANTPRDPKIAYVGVVTTCLGDAPTLDAAFGPPRFALNAGSAIGNMKSTPIATFLGGFAIFVRIVAARLRGAAPAPFFDGDGRPIHAATVLSTAERAALDRPSA